MSHRPKPRSVRRSRPRTYLNGQDGLVHMRRLTIHQNGVNIAWCGGYSYVVGSLFGVMTMKLNEVTCQTCVDNALAAGLRLAEEGDTK